MKKEMLINVLQPEECRIAILEDGVLEELYVERTSHESYVGNIYKGRIVNIEPSIQAAFVDFGVGRNGFLHVSDVEPAYYRHLEQRQGNDNGQRRGQRARQPQRPPRREAVAPLVFEDPDADPIAQLEPEVRCEPASAVLPSEEIPVVTIPEVSGAAPILPPPETETTARPPEATLPAAEVEETPTEEKDQEESTALSAEGSTETAEAQASVEAEATKPRRRRSTGRSRKARSEEVADGTAPAAGESAEPIPETGPASETTETRDEKPRPMESAEHRTKQEDSGTDRPTMLPGELTDEDLSFSHRPPAQEVPERRSIAPPVEEPEEELAPEPEPSEPIRSEDFENLPEEEPDEELAEFENLEEEEQPRRRHNDRRRGGPRRRRMGGRPGSGRPKPLIQDIFKRGPEVLVQVIKEGIGTKGPTLSTYISIAGRYLVLMPGLNRIGVSRKITDEDQRRRLREILGELQPPKGLGFIIRTAGLDRTKKELQRDLAYLSRLWQVVVRRIRKLKAPAEIYQESDMITRTIRDTFTADIENIIVDEAKAFEHAQEFLQVVMPRYASRIRHYDEPEPLFHKYGIEDEIARIQQRHVPLPNGGSIVIDQTEALVAIDVNSGNFRADNNAEETAYQMNLLAAKEIARQLRLRDLGGVIINDFIDMRDEKHRRGVERALREAMKRDRARTKILRISQFGIIEMTRQRVRPSLKRSVYMDCPHCHGTGQVKTCESMSIDVMRMIQLAVHRPNIVRIEVRVHPEVAHYLLNRKRGEIHQLENSTNTHVLVFSGGGVSPEYLDFMCFDNNNNEVKFLNYDDPSKPRRR